MRCIRLQLQGLERSSRRMLCWDFWDVLSGGELITRWWSQLFKCARTSRSMWRHADHPGARAVAALPRCGGQGACVFGVDVQRHLNDHDIISNGGILILCASLFFSDTSCMGPWPCNEQAGGADAGGAPSFVKACACMLQLFCAGRCAVLDDFGSL